MFYNPRGGVIGEPRLKRKRFHEWWANPCFCEIQSKSAGVKLGSCLKLFKSLKTVLTRSLASLKLI